MSVGQALPWFEEREEPGLARSIAFAFSVHVVLLAALIFGVRWQSHQPEAVVVELWEAPPAPLVQDVEPPKPVPEAPKPAPEPPRAVPEPEPRIAAPDIALKAPKELKLKPDTTLKAKPKPAAKPKPEPQAARVKAETQQRMRDELAREQVAIRAEREEAEMRELLARSASATRSKALADYEAKIRGKVRGNIVLPPDLEGNPEAIFAVVQLPTGEVLSVKLLKSSGHKGYDDAVERAILKSSPLPKPEQTDVFSRELKLTFRPLEK
jgi:colicin import membrane protein